MARLSLSFSITSVAFVSGICAAALGAGCTELLGADWDGHPAAETTDGGAGDTDGSRGADAPESPTGDGAALPDAATLVARAVGLASWHSAALDDQGRVHAWGDNTFGEVGLAVNQTPYLESSRVVPMPEPLSAVAAGSDFNCVLAKTGNIYCWGGNMNGELGRTTPAMIIDTAPALVQGLTGQPARAIAARSSSVCAVLLSGKVACWGSLPLANHSDRPVLVQGVDDVASIGVGTSHVCVVRNKGGSVACWGSNSTRQLGTDGVPSSPTPLEVTLPGPAVDVVAGAAYACALLATGAVHCWGDDTYGQLGPGAGGTKTPIATPVPVPGIFDARAIAAGEEHTCVATARGTVVCWGNDADGRLGGASLDGGTVEVFGLTAPADQVGAGSRHSCAKLGDAAPMCWGSNGSGQLGSGNRLQEGPAPRTVKAW